MRFPRWIVPLTRSGSSASAESQSLASYPSEPRFHWRNQILKVLLIHKVRTHFYIWSVSDWLFFWFDVSHSHNSRARTFWPTRLFSHFHALLFEVILPPVLRFVFSSLWYPFVYFPRDRFFVPRDPFRRSDHRLPFSCSTSPLHSGTFGNSGNFSIAIRGYAFQSSLQIFDRCSHKHMLYDLFL
jgi:hypothetical protein